MMSYQILARPSSGIAVHLQACLGPCKMVNKLKSIRIFNGCDVLIENPVTRVTVRHHEAC